MKKMYIAQKNSWEKNQIEKNQAENFSDNFKTKLSQPCFCQKMKSCPKYEIFPCSIDA